MDDLRIGTEEREVAIAALGTHLAAGRLSAVEFEDRAGRAAAAQVRAELRPLFDDLPPPHPPFLERSTLPEELRAVLAEEGTLVLDADVAGEVTYRNFRAPGVYYRRRTITVAATVAVTGRRLIAWVGGSKQIDMPFSHPLRTAVTVTAEPPDLLRVTTDAGAFHPDRSGRIETRLRTLRAVDIERLFRGGA